jgi:uncharacterized protein YkwD
MFITLRVVVYTATIIALFSSLIMPYIGYGASPKIASSKESHSSLFTSETVVAELNAARVAAHFPPYRVNDALMRSAEAKGLDMVTQHYFAHSSPFETQTWSSLISGSGYRYSMAGENLAIDFFSAADVVAAMMKSPPHRANILSTTYDDVGVSVVPGENLGYQRYYVVMHFASPAL